MMLELLRSLALLLAPFAPHLAAELWEQLGRKGRSPARALAGEQCRAGQGRRAGDPRTDQRQACHVVRVAADADNKTIEAAALAMKK